MYDSDDSGSHDNEDEAAMARAALRQLASQPAPPLRTDFQTVLARGKRRLFYQRAAASLGVVVVLVGIAVGSTVLARHDRPSSLNTAVGGDSVTLTTSPSTDTSGWTTVTGVPATGKCDNLLPNQMTALGLSLASAEAEVLREGVAEAVQQAEAAGAAVAVHSTVVADNKQWPYTGLVAVVTSKTSGQVLDQNVTLTAWRFSGTPTEAADQTAYLEGVCAPPTRLTLANGTVVQRYPSAAGGLPDRGQAVVDVYTDKGVAYQLSTVVDTATSQRSGGGSGSSAYPTNVTDAPSVTVAKPTVTPEGGASTGAVQLLLDERQLAQAGVLLGEKLG